ncbi:MAG: peptidoglycan DD-metalloendopeptidase family protein [Desulfobacterales bacterium]|nr:peptidoglycan DD-metalloendopeptidase family protein [Desulfobacterales bacterium]
MRFRTIFIILAAFHIFFQTVIPNAFGASSQPSVIKGVVKSGDTASTLLNDYLGLKTIYQISRQSMDTYPLPKIRVGHSYRLFIEQDKLAKFEYEIDEEDKLVIRSTKEGFSITKEPIFYDIKLETVSATINYSLFEAVRQAGERNRLAIKLADIFAWDIDFLRDIRPQDKFQVLVEKRYRDGKFAGYGQVKAAMFINQGVMFKAFLHKDSKGRLKYYDGTGNSLEKAFLKAPLAFSRISSKFTKKRFHPILKRYRAHPGIDYAAPTGTPIKAVGDGVITQIGYSKTMGNYVVVRHFQGYETRYYHMSKFAKHMKRNKKIVQGKVIGYVGMTGLATGPHLCFRMKKNGKPVNPLGHQCPSADPVPSHELESFLAKTRALFTRMLMARTTIAAKKPSV